MKKEYQGKGFGRLLLNKGLELAETMGKDFVWLGVWEKNTVAIAFYKKMGFTESGTHVFNMGDEQHTDYIMRKTLKRNVELRRSALLFDFLQFHL